MIAVLQRLQNLWPARALPVAGKAPSAPIDHLLLMLVGVLLSVGIVMVTSSSLAHAEATSGHAFAIVFRHFFYLGIGLTAAFLVTTRASEEWQRVAPYLLISVLVMLVMVLVLGREVNGAKRWLGFGGFTIQVSELAKLFVIIYLADYLERRNELVRTQFEGFARPLFILAFTTFLLLMEPDFGATVVIVGTCFAMLFLAGAKLWQFFCLAVAALMMMGVVAFSASYRLQRLKTFLDPWDDPFGKGYQLTQSLIAFGRGETWGQGLGNSLQKMAYLPEAHTDFVFAVFAEEFGLVGVVLALSVFAALIARILQIALRALKADLAFQGYACSGVAIWIALQTLINVGVASGALPTKGLTLPFISYGGNALIVTLVAIAFVLRVDFETRQLTNSGAGKATERGS